MARSKKTPHLEDGLYDLFRMAARNSLIAFRQFSEPPYGLTLHQARVLLFLRDRKVSTRSVGELARGFQWSVAWASRVAYYLNTKGLVECIRDGQDRRLVHLSLTTKGIEIADFISTSLRQPVSTALSEVHPDQRTAIMQFLRRFATELGVRTTSSQNKRRVLRDPRRTSKADIAGSHQR